PSPPLATRVGRLRSTGAMALLMITLVKSHGLEYLFAATILTGVFQLVFRLLRLSRYMKFVPER
ncbi:SulP family inorganic anion transporter, partial [Corallococcus terminator]|uniref:SulP family inorganic anion transporter n=1 Tax=Corallococcus terminator TaxID=2316733 RepID=UPI00244C2D2F